jgi:predicted MFS family arabinose efflux permease
MGFYVTVLALGIAFGEFVVGGVIFERLGLTVTAIAAAVMFAFLSMPTVYMLLRSSNNHSSS